MFKKLFITGVAALSLLTACEPLAELTPVLQVGPAPAISSPADGSAFVLEEANADQSFATFTWSEATFGFDAAVKYTLQMAAAGTDFASPVDLGVYQTVTSDDAMTVGEMNGKLLANGFADGVPSSLELRVVAEVSPEVDPVISAPITISVTPYKSTIVYPQLGVPGAYQGWNPGDSTTAVYSRRNDNTFEGYAFFETATMFKYTQGPSWDTNWGDDGADGTLDPGGADISSGDAGVFRLNVDLNSLTHTFVKTDWGLVGDATGSWDVDQNMTYDAASRLLTITLDLVVGEIKFRANDAWDINLGDDDGNLSMEYGGANIPIAEAGNYTITLDLFSPDYAYTITKN
ncbi:MAG: SusF/SusE family outer membrane protein [Bacteroidetes bacterium]|nr:MAG: SusF/SusE family outer membrane protein [Bacteroidota bacterium]